MRTPDLTIPLPYNPALQDFLVYYAIYQFNQYDKYLLEIRVDEACMCARLAFYMQVWLWTHRVYQYDVDMEYNRCYDSLDADPNQPEGRNVRLGLIVHRRGRDGLGDGFSNMICIELKKADDREGSASDEARLQKLTDPSFGFGYHAGYLLHAIEHGRKKELIIKSIFREGQPAKPVIS